MTNKPGTQSSTLVSVFATREQAECAIEKLQAAGFKRISTASSCATRRIAVSRG